MVNIGDITIQPQAAVGTAPYVGFISRNISSATGTQAITGVGFKPSAVIFLGCVPGASGAGYATWGAATEDDLSGRCISSRHNVTADTWDQNSKSMVYIASSSVTNNQSGVIQSFDSDGFTVSWTLSGTVPSLSSVTQFIAFK